MWAPITAPRSPDSRSARRAQSRVGAGRGVMQTPRGKSRACLTGCSIAPLPPAHPTSPPAAPRVLAAKTGLEVEAPTPAPVSERGNRQTKPRELHPASGTERATVSRAHHEAGLTHPAQPKPRLAARADRRAALPPALRGRKGRAELPSTTIRSPMARPWELRRPPLQKCSPPFFPPSSRRATGSRC